MFFDVCFSTENIEVRFAKWQQDILKEIAPVVAELGPHGPMDELPVFEKMAEFKNQWAAVEFNLQTFIAPQPPHELTLRKGETTSDWKQVHALLKSELGRLTKVPFLHSSARSGRLIRACRRKNSICFDAALFKKRVPSVVNTNAKANSNASAKAPESLRSRDR